MAITHTKVSAIPDEADATLVRPTDWNANHAISLSDMYVGAIVPTGAIDGANVTFTLPSTPNPVSTLLLFKNGILQKQTVDYTISGLTITMAVAPQSSGTPDTLLAFYWRLP